MKLEKLIGNKPKIIKKIMSNELYRFSRKFDYYRQMGLSREDAYKKTRRFYKIK